jgi:hypothetical protein
MSEIKLLSGSPEAAPEGRASICETRELTTPGISLGMEVTTGTLTPLGRPLITDNRELMSAGRPDGKALGNAPPGRALITEIRELNCGPSEGRAVAAGRLTPLGRAPLGKASITEMRELS